jgi:hypothetical protein
VIRVHTVVVLITCAAMLLASPTFAQGVATKPISVITIVAAPIFASAHDSMTPLVMAKQGSRLKVLDGNSDWYHVKFKSRGRGRSYGYIRIKNVALAPVGYSRLKQVDVSVSDDTIAKKLTYRTLRAEIRRRFEESSRLAPPSGFARVGRGTATIDEPRSELKPDMTLGGFQTGGGPRFRF